MGVGSCCAAGWDGGSIHYPIFSMAVCLRKLTGAQLNLQGERVYALVGKEALLVFARRACN